MNKSPCLLLLLAGLACAAPQPAAPAASISASRQNAITTAAQKVSPAVASIVVTQVQIYTYDPFGGFGIDPFFRDFFPRRQYREEVKSMGSGVIISQDGDCLTNAHVVRNATAIRVTLPDNREFDAEVVGRDDNLDLALLRVKGSSLPTARLGTSSDLMIGEWAIAFGNPFGFLLEDAQPSVTVGVISALHREVKSQGEGEFSDMVQTDAAINPGNSGGPLVNADGDVIGINTFIFSHSGGSEGIGFARPIDEVKRFIAETRGTAAAQPEKLVTALGASVSDITGALRRRFRLAHSQGVVVVEVEPGSAAAGLGMATGDVILMCQGKVTRTAAAFAQQCRALGPVINIVIDRQGEQIRLLSRR